MQREPLINLFEHEINNKLSKYTGEIRATITEEGISPSLLSEIISLHTIKALKMIDKHKRYRTDESALPIFKRQMPDSNKIDNKLVNDFFSEIVDTKTGYMFGNPVVMQVDKSMVEDASTYDLLATKIQELKVRSNLDDTNSENCKMAAICGYDAMLAYIDKEGEEAVQRIDPWEAIILSEREYTEPEFAIRTYTTWDDKRIAELYDSEYIYIYESPTTSSTSFVFRERVAHMFAYCPMWGVPNNAELQGDADKVLTLIDAYDRTMSDFNSEIEQFRLAYLLFYGVEPDAETIDALKQTGALYIPPSESGESANDVKYLVKNLDHAALDSHLDRLEDNIMRFAKHVNFTDESFGSSISGVAMRFKIFHLETKAKYFERKHNAALMYMFKVIGSAWKAKGINFEWTTLENKYTRNLPVNLVDEAQAATALMGLVSQRTAISQLSFVNDVDREMEEIEREKGDTVNLDDVDLTENEEDRNEEGEKRTDQDENGDE